MAKLVDAADLKSASLDRLCGFESRSGHHEINSRRRVRGFLKYCGSPAFARCFHRSRPFIAHSCGTSPPRHCRERVLPQWQSRCAHCLPLRVCAHAIARSPTEHRGSHVANCCSRKPGCRPKRYPSEPPPEFARHGPCRASPLAAARPVGPPALFRDVPNISRWIRSSSATVAQPVRAAS